MKLMGTLLGYIFVFFLPPLCAREHEGSGETAK